MFRIDEYLWFLFLYLFYRCLVRLLHDIRRLFQYKDLILLEDEFPLCRWNDLMTIWYLEWVSYKRVVILKQAVTNFFNSHDATFGSWNFKDWSSLVTPNDHLHQFWHIVKNFNHIGSTLWINSWHWRDNCTFHITVTSDQWDKADQAKCWFGVKELFGGCLPNV